MSFQKREPLMTILFCLLFSVTLITAPGNKNKAGPSGTSPQNQESVNEFGDDEPIEEITGNNSCWKNMQFHCGMDNPKSIDFVIVAIYKWRATDLSKIPPLQEYYNSLYPYLNGGHIVSPLKYCSVVEVASDFFYSLPEDGKSGQDSPWEPDFYGDKEIPILDGTDCEAELTKFGNSGDEALRYAFYNTKLGQYFHRIDSALLNNMAKTFDKSNDHKGAYMVYMMKNAKLHRNKAGFKSPSKFCKEYYQNQRNKDDDDDEE